MVLNLTAFSGMLTIIQQLKSHPGISLLFLVLPVYSGEDPPADLWLDVFSGEMRKEDLPGQGSESVKLFHNT